MKIIIFIVLFYIFILPVNLLYAAGGENIGECDLDSQNAGGLNAGGMNADGQNANGSNIEEPGIHDMHNAENFGMIEDLEKEDNEPEDSSIILLTPLRTESVSEAWFYHS